MNLSQAKEIKEIQARLIQERRVISQAIAATETVFNGAIAATLEATGIDGWKQAIDAFEQDEIGADWFSFVELLKARNLQVTKELKALPGIPMNLSAKSG